ncbi:MAG: hypothetical protein ABIH37_02145 [archaeon]
MRKKTSRLLSLLAGGVILMSGCSGSGSGAHGKIAGEGSGAHGYAPKQESGSSIILSGEGSGAHGYAPDNKEDSQNKLDYIKKRSPFPKDKCGN